MCSNTAHDDSISGEAPLGDEMDIDNIPSNLGAASSYQISGPSQDSPVTGLQLHPTRFQHGVAVTDSRSTVTAGSSAGGGIDSAVYPNQSPVPTRSDPRPRRITAQPARDYLPEGPGPLVDDSSSEIPSEYHHAEPPQPKDTSGSCIGKQMQKKIRTRADIFGIYREYQVVPQNIPDENIDVTDLTEVDSDVQRSEGQSMSLGIFQNISTLNLLNWFWNSGPGSLDSVGARDRLVNEVFHAPEGFNPEDIQVSLLHKIDKVFGQFSGQNTGSHIANSETLLRSLGDGWIEKTVKIAVPDGLPHSNGEIDAPTFSVPHFYHRKLTDIIKETFSSPAARTFHFSGYKQYWRPPNEPSTPRQRVVDEVYTSDSFLTMEEEIQNLPPEPNCNLPRAVAGFMFASDGLQLTSFGTASLWPGYAWFVNQSKWERAKPRARAAHHMAYFPKVIVIYQIKP